LPAFLTKHRCGLQKRSFWRPTLCKSPCSLTDGRGETCGPPRRRGSSAPALPVKAPAGRGADGRVHAREARSTPARRQGAGLQSVGRQKDRFCKPANGCFVRTSASINLKRGVCPRKRAPILHATILRSGQLLKERRITRRPAIPDQNGAFREHVQLGLAAGFFAPGALDLQNHLGPSNRFSRARIQRLRSLRRHRRSSVKNRARSPASRSMTTR